MQFDSNDGETVGATATNTERRPERPQAARSTSMAKYKRFPCNDIDDDDDEPIPFPSPRKFFVPNVLYMMITTHNVKWAAVASRVRSHPSEAHVLDRCDFTILHHACRRFNPHQYRQSFNDGGNGPGAAAMVSFREYMDALEAIVMANPSALTARSRSGDTPAKLLCHAIAEVERALLGLPEAERVSFPCSFGAEILKLLLSYNPRAATITDKTGSGPLEALHQAYRVKLEYLLEKEGDHVKSSEFVNCKEQRFVSYVVRSVKRSGSNAKSPKMGFRLAESFWCQVLVLLRASYCGHVDTKSDNTLHVKDRSLRRFRVIHAITKLIPGGYKMTTSTSARSIVTVLQVATRLYPTQLTERDKGGRTPLSLLITSQRCPVFCGEGESTAIHESTKILNEVSSKSNSLSVVTEALEHMVLSEPRAAKVTDHRGLLPLTLAINYAGYLGWNGGLRQLSQAAPEALRTRDRESHMYPFMLAASGDGPCSVNCVYEILRALPEVVKTVSARVD